MVFDDNYFTSVDTRNYFTRNGKKSMYSAFKDVTLGEASKFGQAPLQSVQLAANHGLPSVMVSLMEPKGQHGEQGVLQVDRVSELQARTMGEIIKVNNMNFTMHGPIVDLMGISQTAAGGLAASADKKNKNFNLLKHNMKQADIVSDNAGLEKTPFCIHVSNSIGTIGDKFDSGYQKKNGKPVYGRNDYMIDRDSGKVVPVKSQFEYMNVNENNKKAYKLVPGTETGTGKALFEITPEIQIDMQNRTAVYEEERKIADARIKMKQLKDMGVSPDDSSIRALQSQISTARSKLSHLDAPTFGIGSKRTQFESVKEYSEKVVPKQLVKLAMNSLKNTKTHPVIAVENEPGHQLGSNPELLINWVKKGREEFAEELVKEEGYTRKDAEKKANELIGLTLDTGHLNMLKSKINPSTNKPWTEEELKEQVKKMAATGTKLVHIADNIGELGQDTHMLIGRGNVKNEEFMKILKENGFTGQAQFEAFEKEFGIDKFSAQANLMGLGAPMYSTTPSTTFTQVGQSKKMYSLRTGGYGHQIPQIHFKQWGGPFAGLPSTFGSKPGGSKDKFSGAPTE